MSQATAGSESPFQVSTSLSLRINPRRNAIKDCPKPSAIFSTAENVGSLLPDSRLKILVAVTPERRESSRSVNPAFRRRERRYWPILTLSASSWSVATFPSAPEDQPNGSPTAAGNPARPQSSIHGVQGLSHASLAATFSLDVPVEWLTIICSVVHSAVVAVIGAPPWCGQDSDRFSLPFAPLGPESRIKDGKRLGAGGELCAEPHKNRR